MVTTSGEVSVCSYLTSAWLAAMIGSSLIGAGSGPGAVRTQFVPFHAAHINAQTRTNRHRLLVEFELGRTPGLLTIAQLELELGDMLGREVDLRTIHDLSPHFRDEVVAEARTLHDATPRAPR
ncbi:MAG: hypothetical protein WD225_13350 [Ilumatobacteraceae bacterium]